MGLQEARIGPKESWGMFTWTLFNSFLGLKKLLRSCLEPKKLLQKVLVSVPMDETLEEALRG